ncbi:MAG: YbjN domain-containing protein [Candidatus Heimdallarchaeota archaeon]|nr:YbjN domain-containing protein [Candidatus Heimdallarchaeota archaeon]
MTDVLETIEKVKSWLDELNLNYFVSQSGSEIMLPYKIDERTFNVRIVVAPEWMQLFCQIIMANEIPEDLVSVVHANLLLANFNLNEVTFSIDPEGNVYSENDLPIDADIVTFKSELGAVVFGYQYFYEQLAPQIGGAIEKMSKNKLGIT